MKPAPTSDKKTSPFALTWRLRGGLLLLTLIAYSGSFGLGLALDSKAIITGDARLHEVSASNFSSIMSKDYWWPIPSDGLYRPVTTLSLLFNYSVLDNGIGPTGYHVVNFLLHAVNVTLAFELALLVLGTVWPAFLAAALWAVHPVGTEVVTNIVGRADLLASMCLLACLLLYARHSSLVGWRRAATVAVFFAVATAGVFSKESAAVLIGLMVAWDLTFGKRSVRTWPWYAAAACALGIFVVARQAVLGSLARAPRAVVDNPIYGAGFWAGRLTAVKVIAMDLWLLLCPTKLSSDRSYSQIGLSSWSDPATWFAIVVVAGILLATILRYRRDRIGFWLAAFFALTLLPVSNLLFPIGATMAERFLYLPSLAFAIALVNLAMRLLRRRPAVIILGLVACLFAARTFARNPDWDSDLTLATADVKSSPRSARLHDILGKALFEQDPSRNIDRAVEEQEKACAILSDLTPAAAPELPPAYLGMYYIVKAGLVASEQRQSWFEKARLVLLRARQISQAAESARDADVPAQARPPGRRGSFRQLYLALADVDLELSRFQEALDTARYAQGLDPRDATAYDKATAAYLGLGDLPGAAVQLLEKGQIDGFSKPTMTALLDVYRKLPDASCVLIERNGGWSMNSDCPRLRTDICRAWNNLAQVYADARLPEDSHDTLVTAKSFGCPQGLR